MANPRIDDRDSLIKAAKSSTDLLWAGKTRDNFDMYCPVCARVLRTNIKVIKGMGAVSSGEDGYKLTDDPIIYETTCVNCKSNSYILLYAREDHHDIATIYSKSAKFGSPNAHPSVTYYLDQAQRAHTMGANSAAVAMFRSALEQLLYHEGFINGMLNQKITDLQKSIDQKTGPEWAINLDTDFLNIIKELGNTSIHPNKGDIGVQDRLDSDLVANLQITFLEILDTVYEQPARKAARKALLQNATSKKT